ncbi:Putative AC transposase, partial [Linum perenne]
YDLVREYQIKLYKKFVALGSNGASSSSGISVTSIVIDNDFEVYVTQRKRSRTSTYKTELDHYLTDDVLPLSSDFALLLWWKQNEPTYPILQEIARDLLAIRVTSVPLEAAFSAGGRLLDPHRSRLNSLTVEVIMCIRSWIQNAHNLGIMISYGFNSTIP